MPDEGAAGMKRAADEDDDVQATSDVKRTRKEDEVAKEAPVELALKATEPENAPKTQSPETSVGADQDLDEHTRTLSTSSDGQTPQKTSAFESTSKGVREFLLKAASSAARDTGTPKASSDSSGSETPSKKTSGFGGGGFGAFKAGPNPLMTFAKSQGSGFGGGFGSASKSEGAGKSKTLLESVMKQSGDEEEAGDKKSASVPTGKVLTGEEDEEIMFEGQAKVYRFDAQELKWRERGKGELKVKKRINKEGNSRFRLLLREPETERILVNMSVMQTMSHEISKNMSKQVRVTGVNIADDSQAINSFMIMLKTADIASTLQLQLKNAVTLLEREAASEKPNGSEAATGTQPAKSE